MKYLTPFILSTILLASGCRTPTNTTQKNDVIIFQLGSMSFPLKGTHGIIIEFDNSTPSPDKLRYELYSAKENKLVSTTDREEFKGALSSLPPNVVVDYYDACMGGMIGRGNKDSKTDILTYCHTLGISGEFYVMCICDGNNSNPRTWKWKK